MKQGVTHKILGLPVDEYLQILFIVHVWKSPVGRYMYYYVTDMPIAHLGQGLCEGRKGHATIYPSAIHPCQPLGNYIAQRERKP